LLLYVFAYKTSIIMQNLTFIRNKADDNLIFIQNTLNPIVVSNLIFRNNEALKMLEVFQVVFVVFESIICSENNKGRTLNNDIKYGVCIFLEEFSKSQLINIEISNNFALSYLTGIIIIQSQNEQTSNSLGYFIFTCIYFVIYFTNH